MYRIGQNERGVEFSTCHYIRADEQQFAHEIHRNGSKHEHWQARELRLDFDCFDLDNGGVAVFTLDKIHNFWRLSTEDLKVGLQGRLGLKAIRRIKWGRHNGCHDESVRLQGLVHGRCPNTRKVV